MRAFYLAMIFALGVSATSLAQTGPHGPGWMSKASKHAFPALVEKVEQAVAAEKMGVVFKASASANVKARLNETIPGNAVIGVFRPDYAKRLLAVNIAAGIEAPLRLYITENADGTASVSYRTAAAVFAPYGGSGGDMLKAIAAELDAVLEKITAEAVK